MCRACLTERRRATKANSAVGAEEIARHPRSCDSADFVFDAARIIWR